MNVATIFQISDNPIKECFCKNETEMKSNRRTTCKVACIESDVAFRRSKINLSATKSNSSNESRT